MEACIAAAIAEQSCLLAQDFAIAASGRNGSKGLATRNHI
jgi:hypothetical protein